MILADFCCPYHGRFEALADADWEAMPCPSTLAPARFNHGIEGEPAGFVCMTTSPWAPSPIRGRVNHAEVVRGTVDRPESKMYLDTRELGAGMPMEEWRAKRDRVYEERRHKEGKEL
jgi:hypothetical protein